MTLLALRHNCDLYTERSFKRNNEKSRGLNSVAGKQQFQSELCLAEEEANVHWGINIQSVPLWCSDTGFSMPLRVFTEEQTNVRINVILRRVPVTIFAVKNNKYSIFWVCVCSLSYSACRAHTPYYIVDCGLTVWPYFFHFISQTAQYSGKSSWT